MRVWSTHRPISIGTYPKEYGAVNIVNFDRRVEVPEIGGRLAYGYIDFERDLPEDEQQHYDLIPAKRQKDKRLDAVLALLVRAIQDEDWGRIDSLADKATRLGVVSSRDELYEEYCAYVQE